jgi:uncharacterized lipoprotein
MRSLTLRLLAPCLSLVVLTGCSATRSCFDDTDYLAAVDRPRLQMPEGVPGSERIAPLEIPPAAPDATKLDPEPRCLDEPPSYFARKTPVAGAPPEKQ